MNTVLKGTTLTSGLGSTVRAIEKAERAEKRKLEERKRKHAAAQRRYYRRKKYADAVNELERAVEKMEQVDSYVFDGQDKNDYEKSLKAARKRLSKAIEKLEEYKQAATDGDTRKVPTLRGVDEVLYRARGISSKAEYFEDGTIVYAEYEGLMEMLKEAQVGGKGLRGDIALGKSGFTISKAGRQRFAGSGSGTSLTERNSENIEDVLEAAKKKYGTSLTMRRLYGILGDSLDRVEYELQRLIWGHYSNDFSAWGNQQWSQKFSELKSALLSTPYKDINASEDVVTVDGKSVIFTGREPVGFAVKKR